MRRVAGLNGAAQAMLLLIAAGYWSVQIAEGSYYRELADNNRLRKLMIEAPRGQILDRYHRPLVENTPSYSLLLDRSLTRNLPASKVSKAVGVPRMPKSEAANPRLGSAAKAASRRRRSRKATRTARRRGWGKAASDSLAQTASRRRARGIVSACRYLPADFGSEDDGRRVNGCSSRPTARPRQYSKPCKLPFANSMSFA